MPIDKNKDGTSSGSTETNANPTRKGRPPWVKETPNPLPTPTMPWTLNKRNSLKESTDDSSKLVVPKLRKVVKNESQENGNSKKETTMFQKPQLKPVPPKETTLQSKEVKIPIPKLNSVKDRELPPLKRNSVADEVEVEDIDKVMPATRNAVIRQESMKKFSIPNAPPLPPQAPPLPKLPEMANLSDKQREVLTQLRQRPKHRPDWTQMLKDLERGKQLKHIESNDRSKPLLPKVKSKGQFIFESENHQKNDPHHDLLKQIEQGIKLKKVKTNDRSKPVLDGLRKFRRQMTIEEQIIKSQSMASIPPEEIPDETDEMDDIDKVRDDLQSTKQLLAFEMRNKEAQIRENKKLTAKIQQLEAELEKLNCGGGANVTNSTSSDADQKIITSLKQEAQDARKTSEELEKKYSHATEELDTKKTELEEARRQNRDLEKRLQEFLTGKRQSISAAEPPVAPDEDELMFEVSESESEGSDNEERRERRAQREVKLFRNKLRSCKVKQDNARKERVALKEQLRTHQKAIREEKKKYKALQKEVDKMAKLMKETSEDEDEEDMSDEEDEEEEGKAEESESETESESSESESSEESETDSEASHSEPEDAPTESVKANLLHRHKRHENMLAALKKGNLMLKANVERLQDDLNKQKDMTVALQEDLDSVLAELG